jgi:hypothetical protein
MKFLNHNLFTGDITVNGTTTLSTATGITRATGDNSTHLATTEFVKAQGYATTAALSGYVPITRTITINGTTLDLSADRTWTIASGDYTSKVQHQVKAGVAINKGQAVYVTTSDGTNMIVGLASNATEATSSKTMGLLDATVAQNGFANVVTEGLLAGLNTVGATAGDPVWLGTGGNLIYGLLNKPYAPAHLVFIGIVTRVNANNGEIFVKVQNGFELNEIHDVDLKTVVPVNGHILGFDGTLWVNKTIATWLGYTPANASGTTNYLSKFTGTTTLGNSQIFDNGTNVGIGNTSPTAKLQVGAEAHGNATGIEVAAGAGGANLLALTNSTNHNWFPYTDGSNYYSAVSHTFRNETHATDWMTITSAGKVGIGTTTITKKLEVAGDSASGTFRLRPQDGTYQDYRLDITAQAADDGAVTMAIKENIFLKTYGYYNLTGLSLGVAGYTDLIHLKNSSNVGIGTTSPNEKLHVAGNVHAYAAGGINAGLFASTSAGATTIAIRSNGVTHFNGGNVGIGTTNPSNKLQVANGDMSITTGYSFILADTDTNWRLGRNIIVENGNQLTANTMQFVAANAANEGWQFVDDDGNTRFEIGASTGNAWLPSGNLYLNSNLAWHAGNDGSGSGLDADLLDGVQLDNVVWGNARGTNQQLTNNNNDLDKTGYYTSDGFVTRPSGVANWMYIEHIKLYNDNTQYQKQIGYDTYDDRMWVRTKNAGTWSSWKQIWTSDSLTNLNQLTNGPGYITGYTEIDTLATVAARGNISNNQLQIRTAGNTAGGNLQLGLYSDGASKWSYITSQHYNSSSEPEGFTLIGGLAQNGTNAVVIGGNIYESNPSTEIQFWTHDSFTHNLGGSLRARIDGVGNFGIGTANPLHRLSVDSVSQSTIAKFYTSDNNYSTIEVGDTGDVYSSVYLASDSGNGQLFKYGSGWGADSGMVGLYSSNGPIALQAGGSTKVFVTALGSVGVGTISPDSKLQITSSSSNIFRMVRSQNNFGFEATATSSGGYGLYDYQASAYDIYFKAGTVGIGTTSPSTKLDVNGVITATGGNSTQWNTAFGWGNHASAGYLTSYTETDTLASVTGRGATTSSKVFFTHNATTDPLSAVEINGGGTHTGLYINPAASAQAHVRFGTNGALKWQIRAPFQDGVDTALKFYSWVSGADKFQFEHSGNAIFNGGTVWTSANDGSGSGLDADLWDGYHVGQASNWASRSTNDIVSGMMSWRNYGNGHVIFDASASLSPSGTAVNNTTPQNLWTGTYPTLMGWNGSNTYGVRVDAARVAETASNAGYATTAGSLTSMNISQFTNNSGYIAAGSTVSEAASQSNATRFRSAGDISQGGGNHALQIFADANNDAFMAFHISGDYAVHFGLDDSTNRMYVGGWSDGTGTKYQIWDSRDFSSTNVSNWNTAYGWGNHASQGYATQTYVNTAISNLVDAAPTTLDTLNELAAALGDDPNFATTVATSIGNKVAKAGDTMTGNLNWGATNLGLTWDMNTDGAYIKFFNTGNGDTDSRLEYATYDDGNEYHRWVISSVERMNLKAAGLTVTGNVTCTGTFTETSSRRFKENIVDLEPTAEKVEKLRPVRYNKIDSEATEIGLIAEEVAELFPEVVTYNENGQPSGVQYQRLSVILLKTVQELTERINKLENK